MKTGPMRMIAMLACLVIMTPVTAQQSGLQGLPTRARMDQPVELGISLPQIGAEPNVGQTLEPNTAPLNLAEKKGHKNLVLFFLSEQCGVTFRYKSRLQQLLKDYEGKGFVFVGVRCGKKERPDAPIELAEVKYLKMPFVDDATGVVANCFRVRQSLTFAVIDRAGRLRYRGGFDDNVEEKRVRKPYLRNALRDIAAGKTVVVKEGSAIGCAIIPIGQ